MADEHDRSSKPRPKVGAPRTSLPADPDHRTLAGQRDELLVQLDELEATLRFMGQSHPQRADTEQKLQQLQALLRQLDSTIADRR
jgi:hypothetical protein